MSGKNPYLTASDAYGSTAAATDQRSLEGRILMKAALKLEDLANRLKDGEKVPLAEIGETMEYNQKLWTVFVAETMNAEHPLPQEVKNNIASLGLFVFKRTKDILADTQPEKIRSLIDINRNIAAGLMKQQAAAAPATASGTPHLPPAQEQRPEKSTDSLA